MLYLYKYTYVLKEWYEAPRHALQKAINSMDQGYVNPVSKSWRYMSLRLNEVRWGTLHRDEEGEGEGEGERGGRDQSGWGEVIKRKCGIHEDLETLFRATSSMRSRSMTPGWTRYSRYDGFASFSCIS